MGQPLYAKEEPTGYPNTSEDWLNSAALVARLNFAQALAGNRLPGVRVDASALGGEKEAMLQLGSPEFQRR